MEWTKRLDFAGNEVHESQDGYFTVYFARGWWNCRENKGKQPGAYWPRRTLQEALDIAKERATVYNLSNW